MEIGFGPPLYGDEGEAGVVLPWKERTTNSITPHRAQAPIVLDEHQRRICREVNEAWKEAGKKRPLVVARTAAGKTVIAVVLIKEALDRSEKSLVVVHTEELIQQTSDKLLRYDPSLGDHAFIKAGRPTRLLAPIQVASVQTLHARVFRSKKIDLQDFGLVIIDEAHRARARTYQQIVDRFPETRFLGLTATPCRGDGRGLGNIFDCLILGPSFEELKAAGRLVSSRIFAPYRPDLKDVHIRKGDYVESELAEAMNKKKLVGDIVTHWLRHAEGRPTVVFGSGVGHSADIRDAFLAAGIAAEHIDGNTPKEERAAILARLSAGEIKVVCNYAVLVEGWDQPQVSCLILARPTKQLRMYIQMVGRVLRTAPGKVDALILDHAGSVFEHGFPEDEIAWVLSEDDRAVNRAHAGRKSDHKRGLTTCPECSAVRMEGDPCRSCGWHPKPKPRYQEFVDGDLARVNRDRTVHDLGQDRLRFYRELCGVLVEKRRQGKTVKDGYPASKFKEKFGQWPPDNWRAAEPLAPSPATRSWVLSREIAWRHSQR